MLLEKNISFRDSYQIIASIVNYAQLNKKNMNQLSLGEFKKFNHTIDRNIFQYIDIRNSVTRKKTAMSTNPKKVIEAIKNAETFLKK